MKHHLRPRVRHRAPLLRAPLRLKDKGHDRGSLHAEEKPLRSRNLRGRIPQRDASSGRSSSLSQA
eukprot:2769683-Rhodomonas_salina.1